MSLGYWIECFGHGDCYERSDVGDDDVMMRTIVEGHRKRGFGGRKYNIQFTHGYLFYQIRTIG